MKRFMKLAAFALHMLGLGGDFLHSWSSEDLRMLLVAMLKPASDFCCRYGFQRSFMPGLLPSQIAQNGNLRRFHTLKLIG
jgi:hypothetical protein